MLKNKSENRTTWIDYRNYALVYLLYVTGIRISEALNLDMTDFYNDGMLLIRNGKNSKDRVVYYAPDTIWHIKQYKLFCPYNTTKIMWRSRMGGKLTRTAARNAVKLFIGCSPHELRHSYATHLHANGCDMLVLSELLGHATLSCTQIYTKIQKNELRQCVLKYHPLCKK